MELGSETSETAAANEADRAVGKIQLPRNLTVGPGRCFVEERLNQLAAARRQRRNRVSQRLFSFDVEQHLLGEVGRVRDILECLGKSDWSPTSRLAFHMRTLVRRDLSQPLRMRARLTQSRQ